MESTDKGGVQFVPPLTLEVETAGGGQKAGKSKTA